MQNPFTTTFSKLPENTYVASRQLDEILENFSYDVPAESVYKITGVRGSGKTVVLAKIEETLRAEKGWIVIDLNPNRNVLLQMAAALHKCGYGESDIKGKSANISATILGSGAQIGVSTDISNSYFDIGIEIDEMLQRVSQKDMKVLIGIDEISKNNEMVVFTSEFGKWLRASYPVYLVCTGLYENILELSNVKNLTFFRRATTIKTEALNMVRMTEMYRKHLNIELDEARKLASITKGYAYAFQELGVLCFKANGNISFSEVERDLKTELFAYSYEKIWEEMTPEDRFLASLLVDKNEYKREEVIALMGEKASNYSVYRDRLLRRGIIEVSRYAYISFTLPYFADYIKEYCMD